MADKFQLKALITGVDKLSPKLAGIQKNVGSFRKNLEKTGLGKIGIQDLVTGGAMAAPFAVGVKSAIAFESEMANVNKVVDFKTPEQFKQMGEDITRMSEVLPMAAGDIAKIVAAGGQAGFAQNELLGFAEAALKMGVAFDQTADQSGDMMATWRTSFKMTQGDVIGLADRINYLGNTGPANTKKISDIVTRIGPLGEVAGLASGQIAALGATMAGVGVEQEVAATGIKNFMLAMTKGSSATKAQSQAFKAIRLDSKEVAKSMQTDAQGTILNILERIGKVDAASRVGLLTQLFGSESVTSIASLLTNLDLLKGNLNKVGDASLYAGSMENEYAARAATTENNLGLLRNATSNVSKAIGNALLPAVNGVVDAVRPMVVQFGKLIEANPDVVRGVAAAGIAFTALRLGIVTTIVATKLLSFAMKANPIGIAATAIALAAGLIVTNWSALAPYFTAMWAKIRGPTLAAWELVKAFAAYTPIGLIVANWGPLTEFFKALWGVVVALSTPVMDFLKVMFDWSPLGLIVKNWEPISAWFKSLWDELRPIIEPMMKFFGGGEGGDGLIKTATVKANDFAEAQRIRNAGEGGGTGEFLKANAAQVARNQQTFRNVTQGGADVSQLLRRPDQQPVNLLAASNSGSLLARPGTLAAPGSVPQQAAQNNRAQLTGEMNIRFSNAPPGLRVDPPKTNQPGLSVKPSVGYRTLGSGGTQ
ncbi:phage tail tape measure protein [Pseudomonas proteolytica]|uniref:Phage tail tape measure protein n=1 Tax=Pseudomonas proteolytica TaxID=219574 RepID=A0AAW5A971_9PSED|nr:phage tail tape measure protein [Pseudomonas proteolytica]MCF5056791.1 phage tail tape measure protein [Pseudomonas proteolytica]MCF5102611.1 phage tail tape measure protein [Pseudomonas proteolytica]